MVAIALVLGVMVHHQTRTWDTTTLVVGWEGWQGHQEASPKAATLQWVVHRHRDQEAIPMAAQVAMVRQAAHHHQEQVWEAIPPTAVAQVLTTSLREVTLALRLTPGQCRGALQ